MTKNRIIILILSLMVLSWINPIDKKADDYLKSSIEQASIAYGSARLLNATISVAKSTEVSLSIPFVGGLEGSTTLGEVLDPVDDLIEKFSSIVSTSITSLVLQKFLFVMVTDTRISATITITGFFLIIMLLFKRISTFEKSWKVFLVLIFIRFSLSIPLLMNAIVDSTFINNELETATKSIDAVNKSVSAKQILFQARCDSINMKIKTSKENISKFENSSDSVKQIIKSLKSEHYSGFYGMRRLPDSIEIIVNKNEAEILSIEKSISNIKSENRLAKEQLKTLNGEQKQMLKENVSTTTLLDKINNTIESIINALALFILKSIVLPILFLLIFKSIFQEIWKHKLVVKVCGKK